MLIISTFTLFTLYYTHGYGTSNLGKWCNGANISLPCELHPTAPWCDASASISSRINALLTNLTITEKAALLETPGLAPIGSQTGPVPRLGIPKTFWWHEALHGVYFPGSGLATSWPAVIGVASSFNRTLFKKLGELTGTEGRAMCRFQSDYWTPVINLLREPRWGRAQECPGEDPFLNSEYGVSFVTGLQGDDKRFVRVASTLKHFVGYDAPENHPSRASFDAKITQQDLVDSYFPAFQAAIQKANASGLMCSYNALNGVPMCANPLLNSLVRSTWGMRGYIVSDCNAFDWIHSQHKYTNSLVDTIKVSYGAGMDLYNCGELRSSQLESFMQVSKENEALLTTALSNLMYVQFRLGFFDSRAINPYSGLTPVKNIDTPAWRKLAKEAADQSLVLLTNRNNRLPIQRGKKIALIGPNANATVIMQGNYFTSQPPFLTSPLEGFKKLVSDVSYQKGCDVNTDNVSMILEAVEIARNADEVIIIAGLSSTTIGHDNRVEGEGIDRTTLYLPGVQQQLINKVANVSKKPIILILMSGSPLDISEAVENIKVGAIMWVGYPGQSGGDAIAEAVLGINIPSGKLPMTWFFNNVTTQMKKTQMDMRPNPNISYPGRTYRFFTDAVLFKFGHGMSYTEFSYNISAPAKVFSSMLINQLAHPKNSPHLENNSIISVDVSVCNVGHVKSSLSVLLFVSAPNAGKHGVPLRQLRGFDRVETLFPGDTVLLHFKLNAYDLSLIDSHGKSSIQKGDWYLIIDDAVSIVHII